MLPKIRVGGVPEHFNYPFHLGLEEGLFEKNGVNVEWVEYKLGTGAMIKALKDNEVDVIVALTEGLVSDIVQGSQIRLFATYVKSPLCWAIITGKDSKFNNVEDLKGQKFGVSRFTSGSHLMVCALALERGWHPQKEVNFEVKGNFENLRNSVNDNSTAAFLWEYFTTKPFKNSGEVKFIGSITTPWPCFMLAAQDSFLNEKTSEVKSFLKGLREACAIFHERHGISEKIALRYGLNSEDAKAWHDTVQITASSSIPEAALCSAVRVLYQSQVIRQDYVPPKQFICTKLAEIEHDIKSMKLYNKPELVKFIRNNLIATGKASGPLLYTDLLPFDQHHYQGTDAVELCAKLTCITKDSKVINIGSGLGGPARYLAGKFGCQVLAVELQEELHRTSYELTERCSLQNLVHHMSGDILQVGQHIKENSYDSIVSWLTVLHIPDREKLFKLCYDLLKPGGFFFAEDFYKVSVFTEEETRILRDEVYCPYCPDMNTYKTHFRNAGFVDIQVVDLTADWKQYTQERVQSWEDNKAKLHSIHREDTYTRLHQFYRCIKDLYQGGNLGGARFVVRKPPLK